MTTKVKAAVQPRVVSEPVLPPTIDISLPAPFAADAKETPAEKLSRTANARMANRPQPLAIKGPSEFRVLGLTGREAGFLSVNRGDMAEQLGASAGPFSSPNGVPDVFSAKHDRGDIGNRWSHGAIIQTVTAAANAVGAPMPIAAIIGAAVMLPKEYMYDLHPSPSDMGVVGRVVHQPLEAGGSVDLYGAVYGDKALFGNLQVRF